MTRNGDSPEAIYADLEKSVRRLGRVFGELYRPRFDAAQRRGDAEAASRILAEMQTAWDRESEPLIRSMINLRSSMPLVAILREDGKLEPIDYEDFCAVSVREAK